VRLPARRRDDLGDGHALRALQHGDQLGLFCPLADLALSAALGGPLAASAAPPNPPELWLKMGDGA
jgi:hypothetical protein